MLLPKARFRRLMENPFSPLSLLDALLDGGKRLGTLQPVKQVLTARGVLLLYFEFRSVRIAGRRSSTLRWFRPMAQNYDVSLKSLFLHDGNGIIRRLLFGGRVAEHLATEQPLVSNHRADMVVRNEAGELHHVEFQASNEPSFGLRMAEYYIHLVGIHRQRIIQTVLYLGRDPLRMDPGYTSPSMDFRFEIVNLRELDAAPLLASEDWADIALALLARVDKQAALDVAVSRLRAMHTEDRAWASGTLLLLSGILKIEDIVHDKMKEAGMINVLENKVLGPMILQAEESGRIKGINEGIEKGMNTLLHEMLSDKFGPLPDWATQRLHSATSGQLHTWAKRILHQQTLESILS